jgi:hypothetical protein
LPSDDAAGDGQDVLHRPAGLGPDHVVGPVGAEGRDGDGLADPLAQGLVLAGQGDGGGQAARHLAGEAGPRQHGDRRARQHLGGHVAHQLQRALLDALGAQHHGHAGLQVRLQGGQGRAQVLGRRHGQDQVAGGQGAMSAEAVIVLQLHPGQEHRVLAVGGDRGHDLGLAGLQRDLQAGPGRDLGQGRAPGPGADDAHVLERSCLGSLATETVARIG